MLEGGVLMRYVRFYEKNEVFVELEDVKLVASQFAGGERR